MSLPLFFTENQLSTNSIEILGEETSRHIVQVLRMKKGARVLLTDGKGNAWVSEVIEENKKKCSVKILENRFQAPPQIKNSIGISLLKNTSRFEWFLEKAVEIGVQEIIPLICERTERQFFRAARMKNILVSAMLQSGQFRLTDLQEPVALEQYLNNLEAFNCSRFIAHCMENGKAQLRAEIDQIKSNTILNQYRIVLIGPEGDFTPQELNAALENKFVSVSLGATRLRTETAGMVAASLLANC